jgi:hypothetical protein
MNDLPFKQTDPQRIQHRSQEKQDEQYQPGEQKDQCGKQIGIMTFGVHSPLGVMWAVKKPPTSENFLFAHRILNEGQRDNDLFYPPSRALISSAA